ncbi:MAG TPA: class I SAM-dependent methyltransferase [Pseudonocardiaceae bacterium]|nr:class I SAM-dependent methyltransferase [Pseudonocardiaceae bacterium]
MTATLEPALADTWIRRWDAQQELYVADREERFAVIGDVVAKAVADTAAPVVLDLGCGPGSLSGRLARRLPEARIIGVDADPLLLALAATHYRGAVEFVDADLSTSDWIARVPDRVDAVVSTTALHWLDPDALAVLYRTLGNLVRPGGVFCNGDHLPSGEPELDALTKLVRQGRAERAGVTENEDWATWWAAIGADRTLAPLISARSERAISHHGSNSLSVHEHANLLREAGFAAAGAVWQSGDDHVLVGIR